MEEIYWFLCPSLIQCLNIVVFSRRARAIRFRQDGDEAVGGFFSQIGQLYMVHHLWGIHCFIPSFFVTGTSQFITK